MEEMRFITLEDSTGFRKTIPAEKLRLALDTYAEMRKIAFRAGYTEEEAKKRFTWRIVPKEE